ncbi:MAG: hypothetical protein N3E36_04570 [Sulfolobales archaeon]|nr:hypothetical protein [Sulfolobales archaeon]MCX8199289.1 hypothetical protein [Sulfolobales archaeon]MDW8170397.1 hypothetical protein [Desulfurococcaceae archaeon]
MESSKDRLSNGESQIIETAVRMLKAFKNIGCFLFEKHEYDAVRRTVDSINMLKHVKIELVDQRYPYIYVVKPKTDHCFKECENKAGEYILRGEVKESLKNIFKKEFISQCIRYCEKRKISEVIALLENFLSFKKTSQSQP